MFVCVAQLSAFCLFNFKTDVCVCDPVIWFLFVCLTLKLMCVCVCVCGPTICFLLFNFKTDVCVCIYVCVGVWPNYGCFVCLTLKLKRVCVCMCVCVAQLSVVFFV